MQSTEVLFATAADARPCGTTRVWGHLIADPSGTIYMVGDQPRTPARRREWWRLTSRTQHEDIESQLVSPGQRTLDKRGPKTTDDVVRERSLPRWTVYQQDQQRGQHDMKVLNGRQLQYKKNKIN